MENIRQLLKRSYRAQLDGHDTVFCITGSEGSGKSNLLLDMNREWCDITKQEENINSIGLDGIGWVKSIKEAPEVVGFSGFDEAGDGLLSRDAMSDFNKDIVKLYTVIRGKRLMTILVLPSFWYLDKFFRMHRVKGLFHVYKRGRVAFWNKRQIKQMILKGEDQQNVFAVKPSLRDMFPLYDGILLDDYKRLKKEKIHTTINDIYNKYCLEEEEDKPLSSKEKEVMSFFKLPSVSN